MIFDVSPPPLQPDAELNSDVSKARSYVIQDGEIQEIAPGDWVRVYPGALPIDPAHGYNYQVCNVYQDEVGILMLQNPSATSGEMMYFETHLSPCFIVTNFRHVQGVKA